MPPPQIAIDASRMSVAERTGTERYSYELIAALARVDRWRRYTLYTNGLPAALPPLGPNFALRSIPLPRLWTHARLGPALAAARPDLLFVPSHVVPLAHPASVVTIHDLGYLAFPEAHTARRRLELNLTTRWSLRAARRVIAISQATKDDLLRHYGADPGRVAVVHHGLSQGFGPVEDPAAIVAARARHGLGAPYLLYVGTLQPRKNLERLIEAFALALQDEGPKTKEEGSDSGSSFDLRLSSLTLAIAGRKGWLSDAIERRARELGIAERVRFLGYLPDADLPALLSGATAFVFPSLYEGFGMPVLEAMACGAPVLTANSSSLPEVAGDAALLVDPRDTHAIAAAIVRLVHDRALRADLRARGLARAATFTWERCANETIHVLAEALSPP
jgi:glycosyltransferase involved in cell wall biosynthesis